MAGGHPTIIHHRRRLRQGPLYRLGIAVWSPCHHHIRQRGPVGGTVKPAEHPAFTHDSISSPIKRIGRAVPQAAEGRFMVPGRRRLLARPPPLGDAGHQGLLQGRQRIFTSGGGIRFTTDPARPVCQHRRITVAILLSDLQTTMTGRLPPTTRHNSTQLQTHLHYQRSCCWPASFWSAGTVRSRCCR
jgi:hypothetical protein